MEKIIESIGKFFSQLFASSSPEAYDINTIFLRYLILAGLIISIVASLVVISAIKFRASKRPDEPKQIFGNKKLEITWTVLPFIAVTFFFVLTIITMQDINKPVDKNKEPDIIVIAHQWWWDFRYPKEGIITANELHIPAGKKLLMEIKSADVIHSWWVPTLGRKTDAVPGRVNYGWIEADSAGIYSGKCSEYCGTQHAWMLIRVVAHNKKNYEKWVKHNKSVPSLPQDSVAQKGALIFQQKTCANCHAIKGTPADVHIGPDLTHLASRATLLSGMKKNTEANLRAWLKDPQKIKKGAHMPNFRLSNSELNALVTYLEGLK